MTSLSTLSTDKRLACKLGDVIFEEGRSGDSAYLIVDGKVEIRVGTRGSSPHTLATCSKGDVIGEMSLIDNQAHSGTAVAVENTTLIAMSRAEFQGLLDASNPVMRGIMLLLVKRLRQTVEGLKPEPREVNLANWKPEKKK